MEFKIRRVRKGDIMNKSKKQRGKLLEKIIEVTNPTCNMKRLMIIAAFTVAALCAFMFIFVLLEDEELYFTILTNVCITFAMTSICYFIGSMFDYKNNIIVPYANNADGSYSVGAFVSTLPFKASDMMLYRLERCKKQVFTMWLFTSLFIVPINIYGYDKYGGVVIGMIVLMALLLEIIFISVSLHCRNWMWGMIIVSFSTVAVMIVIVASFELFRTVTTEQAVALSETLGGSSILTVILGIIALAGLLFAAVKIAERLASRAKNTSWKLD